MKKALFVSAMAMAGSLGIANAADMPAKAPLYNAPPPAPVFSWTGFYIGGNVGGAWGNADPSATAGTAWFTNGPNALLDGSFVAGLLSSGLNSSGIAIGGVQAGYNFQVNQWVFGVEADGDALDLRGAFNTGPLPAASNFPGLTFAATGSAKADYLVTLRGRLGIAFDRLLLYGTGGIAFSDYQISHTVASNAVPGALPPGFWSGASDSSRVGWVAGGGLEYAITNNWTLRGEYLHSDFGNVGYTMSSAFDGLVPNPTFTVNSRLTIDVARAGVSYKF